MLQIALWSTCTYNRTYISFCNILSDCLTLKAVSFLYDHRCLLNGSESVLLLINVKKYLLYLHIYMSV